MKTAEDSTPVKVRDDLYARLRVLSARLGVTVSDYLDGLIRGPVYGAYVALTPARRPGASDGELPHERDDPPTLRAVGPR